MTSFNFIIRWLSLDKLIENTMIRQKRLPILILLFFLVAANIQSQNPVSFLKVKITDQNSDNPSPVRVKITGPNGNVTALPGEVISVMYGRDDKPERYSYQPDS